MYIYYIYIYIPWPPLSPRDDVTLLSRVWRKSFSATTLDLGKNTNILILKYKLNVIFSMRDGCIRTARESGGGGAMKFKNGKTHTGRREWKTVSPHHIRPSLWWDHWCPSLQRHKKHQSPMIKWKKTLLNHSPCHFWGNSLTAYFSQSEKQETFQKKMWGIIIINISVVWAMMTHCTAQRCNYG